MTTTREKPIHLPGGLSISVMSIALMFLAGVFSGPVSAQVIEESRSVLGTPAQTPRPSPLAATFNPVPSFERIKTDMDMVGSGLEPLLKLDEELQKLGSRLVEQVKKLGVDQNDPVAASEASKLVTQLQAQLVKTISEVLANSDLIELGIGSANRKLHTLEKYLNRTEKRFSINAELLESQIEGAKEDALDAVNEYISYIDGLVEPISREDRLQAMKLEGKVQEKKFGLELLKLDSRRQTAVSQGYGNMSMALGSWIDDFNVLKTKTHVMVKQLQAEQDFIARGIQMSVDAARVRQFMENPLRLPDGTSIQAINDKVARIFSMVELFTGIQGKVQESLFGFNAVGIEDDLTRKEKTLTGMKDRAKDLKRQILGK